MITDLYSEYGILDAQIKELETKKESLRKFILEDMQKKGEDKKDTDFGKFTIAKTRKWEYSEKVSELSEKYKALKAKEESCGIATCVESEILKFISVKF